MSDIRSVDEELARLNGLRNQYRDDKEAHDIVGEALVARKLEIEEAEEKLANHLYGQLGRVGTRQIRYLSETEVL